MEQESWARGERIVVGMDEVGRGAWAGPLTIGAVVLPTTGRVRGVRDSKMLREDERESLYPRLVGWCAAWSVGHATNDECDRLGMREALRLAARRALDGLGVVPDRVLLDGLVDFVGGVPTRTIVKGDATCLPIAAASVVAKVTRDRMMRAISPGCDAFDFAANKGYPSPVHRAALRRHGPTIWHRRSWSFMDDLEGYERYRRGEPTLFDVEPEPARSTVRSVRKGRR